MIVVCVNSLSLTVITITVKLILGRPRLSLCSTITLCALTLYLSKLREALAHVYSQTTQQCYLYYFLLRECFVAVQKRCVPTADAISNSNFTNIIADATYENLKTAIQNIKLLAQAQEVVYIAVSGCLFVVSFKLMWAIFMLLFVMFTISC